MTFPPINPKPTERTVNFMMLMLLMMLMMRTMRMMLVTWTLPRSTHHPPYMHAPTMTYGAFERRREGGRECSRWLEIVVTSTRS